MQPEQKNGMFLLTKNEHLKICHILTSTDETMENLMKNFFEKNIKKVLTFDFICAIILTVTDAGVAQWQSS